MSTIQVACLCSWMLRGFQLHLLCALVMADTCHGSILGTADWEVQICEVRSVSLLNDPDSQRQNVKMICCSIKRTSHPLVRGEIISFLFLFCLFFFFFPGCSCAVTLDPASPLLPRRGENRPAGSGATTPTESMGTAGARSHRSAWRPPPRSQQDTSAEGK